MLLTLIVLYPLEAIGGAAFTLLAAGVFHLDAGATAAARIPIYTAAGLALGGLLTTAIAAPKILSLRSTGADPGAVSRAFDGFRRWGNVRAVFQVSAFAANVWSLVAVLR